jgi:hypothetical protein
MDELPVVNDREVCSVELFLSGVPLVVGSVHG